MPVGRIILKSISASRKLAQLKTDGARLLYTWLIPHLNIHGCYEADPLVIRSHILSRLDKTVEEIAEYLDDMESVGLIQRYESNNDVYLYMPDFKEKQPSLRPDREGKSHIPLPTPDLLQQYSNRTPAQVKLSKVKISKDRGPSAVSKETEQLLKTVKERGFNIYQLLGKMNKSIGWLPDEVVNRICESYLKNSHKISKPWPWFVKATNESWMSYNSEQSIKEGEKFKKMPIPKELQDLTRKVNI